MQGLFFRRELGLSLMFCEQVINDLAGQLGVRPKEFKLFIWIYYFTKFISKKPFVNVRKTMLFLKAVDEDVTFSYRAIHKVLDAMVEKEMIKKINAKYIIDDNATRILMISVSKTFMGKIHKFETLTNDANAPYNSFKPAVRYSRRKKFKLMGRPKKKRARKPRKRKRYTKTDNPWLKLEAEAKAKLLSESEQV